MKKKAVVYAEGLLHTSYAKTAHGLIRGTCRYDILGVIDSQAAGRDAGEMLDGVHRAIPVYDSLESALATQQQTDCFIVGVAPDGGKITAVLKSVMLVALEKGLDLVSGLHTLMCEDAALSEAAARSGRTLTDIRKPKKREALHFWSGEITKLETPRIAVLGTDCALGKRTTAKMMTDRLNEMGVKSAMIYTGQTGWLQGWEYGFILDATPNDFVCGELEHVILSCAAKENPSVILLEGQSSLRNPAGPCGAEFLLSAGAKQVILQTAPARQYFEGLEAYACEQASIQSEVALVQAYGAEVIAITINSENLAPAALASVKEAYQETLHIPVIAPLQDGIDEVADIVATRIRVSSQEL